jgi:hypothetical protein
MLLEVMQEVAVMGRAKGAALADNAAQRQLGLLDKVPHDMVSAMLGDLKRGHPLELDWLAGAVDATFATFGIDAVYTPAGGEPVQVRVIARRPDTIVDFGETRIHAETANFEVRASEVANPRPDDQITVGGDTFVVQGEPERRDPDRLVWHLDVRPL